MSTQAERAADYDRLREGEEETPIDEGATPTPGQWLRYFNMQAPADRLTLIKQALEGGAVAAVCIGENHADRIEQLDVLQAKLTAAEQDLAQLRALYRVQP